MLGWGAAYVPSAWLVERWPPLVAAGARLGLAGLLLLAGLACLGRPLRPGVGVPAVAWLALTQTVLFYGGTFWGIEHAGAGPAAVLANTDALFVAGLAALVLGETLRRRQWLGLCVGVLGAALVVWRGPAWPPRIETSDLAPLIGALGWSLGTVVAARGVRGRRGAPLALAGWQMFFGGLALLAAGLLVEGAPDGGGAREAALVVGLAILGSALPLALFYLALARAPAARVSAWFLLIPPLGVLSAWPLLGERPGPRLLLGLGAVCLGLWLVLARGRGEGGLVESPPPP
jgi:drug/metabolite transporter (DMT)-like permease